MSNDIIKILLQAEVEKSSVENIKTQLDGIQRNVKPIKLNVDSKGTSGIKDMTLAFDKLEQVTKKNLSLDLDRLSSRYKNLIKPEDVSQIKSMIGALEHTDPKLGHNIDLIKVKMKEVSVGAEQSRRSLDLANKSAMSFGEAMKTAAYKFGIWSAITASYYKVIREISTGIKFITEMDSALTEIGMVTNQTREQTAGLAKEYNNLAKEMKVLTSDLTSSAVEFYRQGLSQEEVMERMRVSTMYSKIANLEFATSAEVLTATVNSMGVDIERAADVFLFLGDSTATSGAEIGKGFQKVGGTASALGIEFEKVASWISVISSKTRESAESIGTSINAMLSRISRITQTGFNEDDDTKLNDVAKALNTVGIALTDQTGNFRDFGTILDEIAVKWDTLDDQTQAYIANTVGGVRQQSRFFNLMNGYAESMDLYEQSLESAGTAQSKFNLYLESNQATLDKFRTTLEGLWITIIDSDSLMDIVRAGTSFIELLDSMANSFGLLGSAATILIPLIGVRYVASVTSATKAMIAQELAGKAIGNSNISLMNGFKLLIGQLFGVKTAADGTAISFMGLNAAAGLLGVALVAIPVLITAIATAEDKRKKAMEESLALFEKQNEANKSIGELVKSYEELGDKAELTAEESKKLLDVKTKIKDLLPQSKNAIDNENLSLKEQVEIIKDLNEQEFQRASMAASETIDKYGKDVDFYKESIDERAKSIENMTDKLSELQLKQARGQELTSEESKELKNLIQWIELYNEHQENAINIVNAVESAQELLNKGLEESAERYKWARAEEIASQDIREMSISQAIRLQDELKELGFSSDEVTAIMKGNLEEVKESYELLDDAMIQNMITIEDLNETDRVAKVAMLERSRELTTTMIANTRARITAMHEEGKAALALAGINPYAKKAPTTMPMPEFGKSIVDTIGEVTHYKIGQANNELGDLESKLGNINKALANLDTIGVANSSLGDKVSGTKDPKKDKKTKAKEKNKYSAEADRYARINLELDKNNILLQKNKVLQQNVGDDLAKKLKLMDEEIDLNNQRKTLLHDLNEEMRKEARELQNSLEKEGFKFEGSWDDNSMVITNLEAISGKGKEVEEQFKRALDIIKTLPKASQEWVDIDFSNIALEIEKIVTGFEIADKVTKAFDKSLADLDYQMKFLSDDDFAGKAQNIADKMTIMEQKVASASKELDEINNMQFVAGSAKAAIYGARIEELTKQVEDGALALHEYNNQLDAMREKARTDHIAKLNEEIAKREKEHLDYIAEQNKLYDEQQARLSALDSIQEKLVAIIRKRGEEEKKALDEAHKNEMSSLDERHKKRKESYKEELDEFNKMIQDKLDALVEQYDEEDYLESLNKERENASEIQRQIDVLSLDDSLTARNKTIELRKQLAEQNDKIAKMQQKKERDTLKKSLQDQLKDKQNDAKDREDIADKLYENEKKKLEEDYEINKEFLDRKYSDEMVYAEAREAIMRGQVEVSKGVFMDIYDAFEDFENKFGRGMGILGDIIKRDFNDQLELAKRAVREMEYMADNLLSRLENDRDFSRYDNDYQPDREDYWKEPDDRPSSGPSSGGIYMDSIDFMRYRTIKGAYDTYKKNNDRAGMEEAKRKAQEIRDKYGITSDKYSYDDLKGKSHKDVRFKKGGLTEKTGIHILDGEPGKPERVLSQQQTKSYDKFVFEDMPKIQDMLKTFDASNFQSLLKSAVLSTVGVPRMANPVGSSGGDKYEINFDVKGNMDRSILPEVQRMITTTIKKTQENKISKYKDVGIKRPVY